MPATNLQVVNNQSDASPSASFAEPLTVAAAPGNVTLMMQDKIKLPKFNGLARLADLTGALKEAAAEAKQCEETIERLNGPIKAAAAAEARLQAILDQEAAAMARWAETGESEPPVSDADAIAEATRARDQALAGANAAKAAQTGVVNKLQNARTRERFAEGLVDIVAPLALADDAKELLIAFRNSLERTQTIAGRLQALIEIGFAAGRANGGDVSHCNATLYDAVSNELQTARDDLIVNPAFLNNVKANALTEWAARLSEVIEEANAKHE